ncbi:MAG: hypothetical protein ACLQBQ_03935 [Smithella sp.]
MEVVKGIGALKGVNILKMSTTIEKLLYFRLAWTRHDLDYLPPHLGPKFISARQVAGMIPGEGADYRLVHFHRPCLNLLLGFA